MTIRTLCILAALTRLVAADAPPPKKWEDVTARQIESIDLADAEIDNNFVTPLAQDLSHLDDETRKRLDELGDRLDAWQPGREKDLVQQLRNWMSLCTLIDITHGEFEAEFPYVIFDRLKKDIPKEKLTKGLAVLILNPEEGKVVTKGEDFDLENEANEQDVRERHVIYAKKLLGRLIGKLPVKEQ
jgi:hypothetical protein